MIAFFASSSADVQPVEIYRSLLSGRFLWRGGLLLWRTSHWRRCRPWQNVHGWINTKHKTNTWCNRCARNKLLFGYQRLHTLWPFEVVQGHRILHKSKKNYAFLLVTILHSFLSSWIKSETIHPSLNSQWSRPRPPLNFVNFKVQT